MDGNADRLGGVLARIAAAERAAGRAPGSVRLIAVSKTFAADCHAYFDTNNPASPYSTLQAERKNITIGGTGDLTAMDHAAKTLELYGLIASLTLTYLKVAVMWQWSEYLLPYIQYDKYVAAKAKWDLDNKRSHGAVAKTHPEWAPVPVAKPASPRELWQNWTGRNTTAIVGTFLSEVKDILKYIEGTPSKTPPDGLLPVFKANWDKRAATVSALLQQITIQPVVYSGTTYYVVQDNQNSYTSKYFSSGRADVALKGRAGALLAYHWHDLSVSGALEGLEPGDLDKFQIMVDAWKEARQTVLFKEYSATGGETMAALAATYTTNKFTTDQLIQIIVKANPGLKSYSVLTKDQRVKLPDI